jgi:hypothetical protein
VILASRNDHLVSEIAITHAKKEKSAKQALFLF